MAKKERILPDGDLKMDFVICDNSVNRYGWRLLVEGIDLEGFLKNPVCCELHYSFEAPVGKWENLRIENGQFVGTLVFDRNDEHAVKYFWKYKDGYMSAVSLSVLPIEESQDEKYLLPGQTLPTVVKSELLEISVVTIPGQKNAVKLMTPEGGEYKLSLINKQKQMDDKNKTTEQLQKDLDAQKKLAAENLIKYHSARGVVQEGEKDSLMELAFDKYDTVSKMLDGRTPADPNAGKENTDGAKADALVELHFNRGAITEPEKAVYKAAAKLDYEGTKKVLEARKGKEALNNFVQGLGTGKETEKDDKRSGWGYYDYFKNDPEALELMEKNDPEKYKRLVADFEAESAKLGIKAQVNG